MWLRKLFYLLFEKSNSLGVNSFQELEFEIQKNGLQDF